MAPDGYREGAREREMHRFTALASDCSSMLTFTQILSAMARHLYVYQ